MFVPTGWEIKTFRERRCDDGGSACQITALNCCNYRFLYFSLYHHPLPLLMVLDDTVMSLNNTDVLPPELWELIFRAVCTDGGTTGRTLALVSKRMRYLSDPYQLQSIAIHNVDDATGFISRLEVSSARARSGVRHLYFSNTMMCTASLYADEQPSIRSSSSRTLIGSMMDFFSAERTIFNDERWWRLKEMDTDERRTQLRSRRIAAQISWQINHIIPTLRKVLNMVSSSLRSLTIDLSSANYAAPHSCGNFVLPFLPLLRSFTIRDNSIFKLIAHNGSLIRPSSLPSLVYLDLVKLRFEMGWSNIVLNVIKEIGPTLRYVRVNQVGAMGLRTGAANLDIDGISKVKLPRSLRRVFVQLTVHPWEFERPGFERWRMLAAVDNRFVILFLADEEASIENLVARYDGIES